jgi:hypothetical protein
MRSLMRAPSQRLRIATLLCAVSVLTACRDPRLLGTQSDIRFVPASLELPSVFPGRVSQGQARLQNAGRQTPRLEFLPLPLPFKASALPERAQPGDQTFTVEFTATEPGRFTQTLNAISDSGEVYSLPLGITVKAIPACPKPIACHSVRFDVEQERCIEEPLSDGTSCEEQNACLLEATCQQGQCLGKARACDDENKCTVDVCNARTGCEFLPAPPCPGDGKCQVGTCDPKVGCGTAAAGDGTLCGPSFDCDLADVCISGNCVQRDPPDKFVCAPASPCQGEGRCSGSVCEQPAPVTLLSSWSQDTLGISENELPIELHDLFVENDGNIALSGFFGPVVLRASSATPIPLSTPARRCQLWNGQVVCADNPSDTETGKVSGVAPQTGQTQWTFDVVQARPDFAREAATGMLFMARMASLGTDRLAALFEAYPLGTDRNTQCRLYFLVVLGTNGTLIYAQKLEDGFLDICNHPHPFGFTADAMGNLFIAFSGSSLGTAPLEATSPTLLMAFSRDGILQWKRQESYAGGELATARGYLFPEWAPMAHRTSNGAVAYALSAGRPVSTNTTLIPSPSLQSTSLSGHDLSTGQPRWQSSLPSNRAFASDVIRMAEAKVRPELPEEPVVLSFLKTLDGSALSLWATRASDGTSLWTCNVETRPNPPRSAPVLFEVTQNQLSFMAGTQTCGRCDPPFARSQAEFVTVPLPGVNASTQSPWPGNAGGPAHEYQESFSLDFNFGPGR